MRKVFVIADENADLSRIGPGDREGAILEVSVPGSEQSQLHAVGDDRWSVIKKEIEPFLPGQAADDAEQEWIRRIRQTETLLQGRLVGGAILKMVRVVAPGDAKVGRGIPDRRIDPIEDPAQVARSLAQEAAKAHTALIVLDLDGIGRRHRRNAVCELQPRLQE